MSGSKLFMPPMGTRDVGGAIHCISFVTVSGTNNPATATISGLGVASITGSAGDFTVTLDQGYYQVVGAFASVVNISSVALWYQAEVYVPDFATDPFVCHVIVGQAADYGVAGTLASFTKVNSTNLRVCLYLYIKTSIGT